MNYFHWYLISVVVSVPLIKLLNSFMSYYNQWPLYSALLWPLLIIGQIIFWINDWFEG